MVEFFYYQQRQEIFLFSIVSRMLLGLTQPFTELVIEAISPQ